MLYLGVGFGFIAIAQLAILLTKFGLYYNTSIKTYVKDLVITYNIVSSSNVIYNLGIFFNKALTLIGLYVIYRLPKKTKSIKDIFLVIYFIILSVLMSDAVNYLFRITAMGLFLVLAYSYYLIYKKNRFPNTMILSTAFGVLALSQILFMMSQINVVVVIADFLELASYITLLVLIIRILKHGTKKEPDGYNLRHAKYHPRKRRKH
jgi:hypothetical protein